MNTTHPTMILAQSLLAALMELTDRNEPHPTGGFTTDDMLWILRTPFEDPVAVWEAMDELHRLRAVRIAGYTDEDELTWRLA